MPQSASNLRVSGCVESDSSLHPFASTSTPVVFKQVYIMLTRGILIPLALSKMVGRGNRICNHIIWMAPRGIIRIGAGRKVFLMSKMMTEILL